MKKVYLAGSINGCDDSACNDWRDRFIRLYSNCLNPMVRDYRGVEHINFTKIVEDDKRDILNCDVLLVYYKQPSVGTSMEILFAWQTGLDVIVVNEGKVSLSPWILYHSTCIVNSLEDALLIIKDERR